MNISHQSRLLMICAIVASTANIASAQKLPNKQDRSVWAGTDVKIDGKLNELGTGFQAYNNAVQFHCTLANDDVNLYLTVQATDKVIINRVINGGLTLRITTTEKNAAPYVAITYPFYEGKERMYYSAITRNGRLVESIGAELDSLVKVNNDRMAIKAKSLKVIGVDKVDTVISIYNDTGIKAAGAFDGKSYYNYELAVPLKYIKSLLNANKKFAYQIRINERERQGIKVTIGPDGRNKVTMAPGATLGQNATDFWGEYTLANK